jgi:hypothetical protein
MPCYAARTGEFLVYHFPTITRKVFALPQLDAAWIKGPLEYLLLATRLLILHCREDVHLELLVEVLDLSQSFYASQGQAKGDRCSANFGQVLNAFIQLKGPEELVLALELPTAKITTIVTIAGIFEKIGAIAGPSGLFGRI